MLTCTLPRVISIAALSLFAAGSSDTASTEAIETSAATEQTLIIDTRIDVSFRLYRGSGDVIKATGNGDSNCPRAKAGVLNEAFMSIYITAALDEAGESVALAYKHIDDMVQTLAVAGGVIPINYSSSFITAEARA